jgi:hypothetical protein
MTDTQPKRRFWQMHLSSLVFVSLLMSVLLGLNLRGPRVSSDSLDGRNRKVVVIDAEGWPVPKEYVRYANLEPLEALSRYRQGRDGLEDGAFAWGHWRLLYPDFSTFPADDIIIGVLIVILATVVVERQARRRRSKR